MPSATLAQRPAADPRVEAIDWQRIAADLDAQGCAVFDQLLTPDECRALSVLYPDDTRFRSRIVMARHGFGRGEYKYFNYPLPDPIAALRPRSMGHSAPSPIAGTRPWVSMSVSPPITPLS